MVDHEASPTGELTDAQLDAASGGANSPTGRGGNGGAGAPTPVTPNMALSPASIQA